MLEDILIKLCNSELTGQKPESELFSSLGKKQWLQMMEIASPHGILPILSDIFSRYQAGPDVEIDDEMYNFIGSTLIVEDNYSIRIKNMVDMAEIFSREGIDIMFFKGAVLAQYYPQPSHRACSDIDYYLFGRTEDGDRALEKNGLLVKPFFHHHTHSCMRGMLLENHYDFLNRRDHKVNYILDDALKKLAAEEGRSVPFVFKGHPQINNAYCMTPTMNAVFLMRHMLGHFVSETVTFRQLYDWFLFLERDGRRVEWTLVGNLYVESGMDRFANIIMLLMLKRMNLTVSQAEYPFEVHEDIIEERVWESIIHPGEPDSYKRYSVRYLIHECRVFLGNKWKHKLCYPYENYWGLFFRYGYYHVRHRLEMLK